MESLHFCFQFYPLIFKYIPVHIKVRDIFVSTLMGTITQQKNLNTRFDNKIPESNHKNLFTYVQINDYSSYKFKVLRNLRKSVYFNYSWHFLEKPKVTWCRIWRIRLLIQLCYFFFLVKKDQMVSASCAKLALLWWEGQIV